MKCFKIKDFFDGMKVISTWKIAKTTSQNIVQFKEVETCDSACLRNHIVLFIGNKVN